MDVPQEIEVEETVEKEVMKDVMETKQVPQVKAMYAYKGQGMKVDKGEVSHVRFSLYCPARPAVAKCLLIYSILLPTLRNY